MHGLYVFITTLVAALVVPSAFQRTATLSGDPVLNGNIALTCSWVTVPGEAVLEVTISPNNNDQRGYYYQIGSAYVLFDKNTSRMSLDQVNFTSQNITMRIAVLECSDERIYYCVFKVSVGSTAAFPSDNKQLTIKVPPKNPTLRILPNSTNIAEYTYISVICNANLGNPGKGSMQWKIYRSGNPDIILPNDNRIVTKNVTLQANDASCTQRIEQTFTMQVTRSDQNLVVACFVRNTDFTSAQTPEICQNPSTELCSKTETFLINYGVSENSMAVSRNPEGDITQGQSVILNCLAPGFPLPSYTWIKDGDENNTLSGVSVDNGNQLVLNNRNVVGQQGETYNCTVTNMVLGQQYSASASLSFLVVATTTSTTTTTTTTPSTTVVTSGVPPIGNNDQNKNDDDDKKKTIIIVVVVVVGSILIIAIIIGLICWRKRSKKHIEEPSEKPYNNRTNLSFQNSQPDLVADKKLHSPSFDNENTKSSISGSSPSFSEKKEDGLMYADLTYDNRPRSRKPMAINDTSSDYSDIQMPQV